MDEISDNSFYTSTGVIDQQKRELMKEILSEFLTYFTFSLCYIYLRIMPLQQPKLVATSIASKYHTILSSIDHMVAFFFYAWQRIKSFPLLNTRC